MNRVFPYLAVAPRFWQGAILGRLVNTRKKTISRILTLYNNNNNKWMKSQRRIITGIFPFPLSSHFQRSCNSDENVVSCGGSFDGSFDGSLSGSLCRLTPSLRHSDELDSEKKKEKERKTRWSLGAKTIFISNIFFTSSLHFLPFFCVRS